MNPLLYGKLALIGAILAAGFAGGWMVNGWRLNAKIAPLQVEISRLQAREVIYEQSNAQCKENVAEANQATDRLLAAGKAATERSKAALAKASAESAKLATSIATLREIAAPADASCQAQSDAALGVLLDEVKRRGR